MNVLLGHMSLIGPRPHMVSDNARYEELLSFYSYRQKVKPGITGLAQVHGLVGTINTLDCIRERVKKDIYYIHHWSFGMYKNFGTPHQVEHLFVRERSRKTNIIFKLILFDQRLQPAFLRAFPNEYCFDPWIWLPRGRNGFQE